MCKDCNSIHKTNIYIGLVYILYIDTNVSLTVVFIVGSGMYYKAEPQGNIMMDVCKCIGVSLVYIICITHFVPSVVLGVSKNTFLFHFFLLLFSLPLKTATGTEASNTQRSSTGWTGLKINMMYILLNLIL